MTRLLYINASPRSDSVSDRGANLFLNALKDDVITQRIEKALTHRRSKSDIQDDQH